MLPVGGRDADVGVARSPHDDCGDVVRPQRLGLAPADLSRIGRRSVQLQHRTTCRAREVHVVCVIQEAARQLALLTQVGEQPEQRTGGRSLKQLPEHRCAPDAGQHVPVVADQCARVDQHGARGSGRIPGRPLHPPGPAEVVHHEVHAVDSQLAQHVVEEVGHSRPRCTGSRAACPRVRSPACRARPPARTRRSAGRARSSPAPSRDCRARRRRPRASPAIPPGAPAGRSRQP